MKDLKTEKTTYVWGKREACLTIHLFQHWLLYKSIGTFVYGVIACFFFCNSLCVFRLLHKRTDYCLLHFQNFYCRSLMKLLVMNSSFVVFNFCGDLILVADFI
jgi:hypothetical protein